MFLTVDGQRLTRAAADHTVKRLARRAGITKRISPHSLRHATYVVAAFLAGAARQA
jgi:integrase/recombinase XerD